MTVGDLIELLQRANPALPVRVEIDGVERNLDDDATGFFIGTRDDHFIITPEHPTERRKD